VTDATIVVPTYRRATATLREAVDSALAQTHRDREVVVVDDGSPVRPDLPAHPRLRVIELATNRGAPAARNVGVREARGRYVTCLDDDDLLLPTHLDVALAGIATSDLPGPVAALTGVRLVEADGTVSGTRLPPTLPRGCAYSLEPRQPGTAFGLRCTLVVERDVLLGIGGWDESFASRQHTELFLRLNPVCSLQGVAEVTYVRRRHEGERVSGDPTRRDRSQQQLEQAHRDLLLAHPDGYAEMLVRQGTKLWEAGDRRAAATTWARSLRIAPGPTVRRSIDAARDVVRGP
jgi:glycosyltransferase involved in cell wall biosynthesis